MGQAFWLASRTVENAGPTGFPILRVVTEHASPEAPRHDGRRCRRPGFECDCPESGPDAHSQEEGAPAPERGPAEGQPSRAHSPEAPATAAAGRDRPEFRSVRLDAVRALPGRHVPRGPHGTDGSVRQTGAVLSIGAVTQQRPAVGKPGAAGGASQPLDRRRSANVPFESGIHLAPPRGLRGARVLELTPQPTALPPPTGAQDAFPDRQSRAWRSAVPTVRTMIRA